MPSLRFAEWMLGLVTSPDRAGAIVGDLAERSATRSVAWFWSAVLHAAASLLWYDIAGHPTRMAGVALRGLALDLGLVFLFGVLSFVVAITAVWTTGSTMGLTGGGSGVAAVAWTLYGSLPLVIFPLVVGRALAHWAPGHEVAACVAFAMLTAILNLATAIVLPGNAGVAVALVAVLRGTAQDLFLVLAGSMWGRRRNLLRREPTQLVG